MYEDIDREILAASEVDDYVSPVLFGLCDDIGPRFAGSPSYRRAVDFMMDRLRDAGLENVRDEAFEFEAWRRGAPARLDLADGRSYDCLALPYGASTGPDGVEAELLDVGERALVFTQFREMGDLLQRHVATRFEVDAPFLHGGVSKAGRDRMVADFQAGAGSPLLLVSLKAGGTGLNLTAASQVIHYDRWWNPAVEDQATDRAWRLGQRRTVNVHKLVCQGTVEERIGEVIDEKRAIADAVVGTGEAWLSELSTEQLAELVVLG